MNEWMNGRGKRESDKVGKHIWERYEGAAWRYPEKECSEWENKETK